MHSCVHLAIAFWANAIADYFSDTNQIFEFLLVSDCLKAYPTRELEFRDGKTFARVPEER